MPTVTEEVFRGIRERFGRMTVMELARRLYVVGEGDVSRYYLDGCLACEVRFHPGDIGRVPNWEIMWHAAA
uniref:Uncharacterized protein n=1 Tax=viral metagenome TaxID=1070528 RepID=A0A6M3KFU9_9ZZZZ